MIEYLFPTWKREKNRIKNQRENYRFRLEYFPSKYLKELTELTNKAAGTILLIIQGVGGARVQILGVAVQGEVGIWVLVAVGEFQLLAVRAEPVNGEQAVGYRKQSVGHRKQSVGYRKQSVGYRKQSVGYRKQSVGHRKQSVNHRKQSVGHIK
jgi:hypothetical protein